MIAHWTRRTILKILTAIAAALLSFTALPAMAQGFYFGGGLGYSWADSGVGSFGNNSSSADFPLIGLTAGYRWDANGYFFATEIDADLSSAEFTDDATGNTCSQGASGPYFCSVDSVVRLRGLVGSSMMNGYEFFGTLGFVSVMGTSATNTSTSANNTNTGYTVGIGTQGQMMGNGTSRIELIWDQANESSDQPGGYDPDYEAITLKFTYLF
jgi:hypothetical protein